MSGSTGGRVRSWYFVAPVTKFSTVREMGPVEYPAYQDTTAAMRSFDEVEVVEETDFKNLERKIQILDLQNK